MGKAVGWLPALDGGRKGLQYSILSHFCIVPLGKLGTRGAGWGGYLFRAASSSSYFVLTEILLF